MSEALEEFREKISLVNWSEYNNKRVMIKGCTSAPVPTWSYLIITAQLALYADQILYGEPCSAIKIFKNVSKNPKAYLKPLRI